MKAAAVSLLPVPGGPHQTVRREVTACAMAVRCRSVRREYILASSCNTGAAGREVASPDNWSASQRKRSAGTDGYCRGRRERATRAMAGSGNNGRVRAKGGVWIASNAGFSF